jgi:KipI family sensor histidine kinase inhibitor
VWSRSVPVGDVRRLGDHALVIGVPEARSARALVAALRSSARYPVAEVVGGLATVMVSVDPEVGAGVGPTPLDELESWVGQVFRDLDPSTTVVGAGTVVEVPCVFDGPDLDEVAEQAGCDRDRVMAHMTAAELTVAVVGFSPGFAYLEGLPGALASIPRRRTPRTVVPAGSVAVANGYAAVYPSASPGGWHLIGRTAEPFFDPGVAPYARLAPGDRVRFVARSELPPDAPRMAPPGAASAVGGQPVFAVEQPGLRTLRQDGGRRGVAALGVPGAGPADPFALEVANRLVGNAAEATALEVTAKGPVLRCLSSTFVAVVGAAPDIALDGQPVPTGQVVPVGPGQRLAVGLLRHGLRCYVAVAGGLVGPAVLGSCATDQLCGLGPGPLAIGDQLRAGPVTPPMGDHVSAAVGAERSTEPGADVVLRVVPGPHPERFATGTFDALSTRAFTVGADSNRIGLRLRAVGGGPVAPADHAASELDSQGTVTGVVQVPPDGQPVILLTDHATLGGYPVLAVVATADHGALGQCAPGDVVRLVPITHAEADQAWAVRRRSLRSAVVGHYPLAVD